VKLRIALIAVVVVSLFACSKQQPPPPAAKPAPPVAESTEPTDAAPLLSAGLVDGQDYLSIPEGAQFDTPANQVEVLEFFNYACPACNAFEPLMNAWKRNLPGDVHVVYAPLDFRPDFVPYARAYYVALALGVAEQSHDAVYAAIHDKHTLPGEGTPADADVLAKFYAQFGAKPEEFKTLMESPEVIAKVAAARKFAMQAGIHGTPSLVIGGKYIVKGDSWESVLKNASQLIVKARG